MSTKRKFPALLGVPRVKPSAKNTSQSNVDESHAVVSQGGTASKPRGFKPGEVVDISSDSSSEGEDDSDDDVDVHSAHPSSTEQDAMMHGADGEEKGEKTARILAEDRHGHSAEPSFGELVQVHERAAVDVAAAFEHPFQQSQSQTKDFQVSNGASLGTVLAQALRTNDTALLESCLQTRDVSTIRATIQRLDSPLAAILLQKLAERLHRRPGRAGSLLIWVQWTLVTHGGYLATQRDLIKKLEELNRVISSRAKSLQSLLSLKGKLDMLEAQMELRRHMQIQHRRGDEADDDEGVIYVEGQEDEEGIALSEKSNNPNLPMSDPQDESQAETVDSEDMPNGIGQDSEDGEEESSDDDLIDDEAEETDADSGSEQDLDHDDADSLEDEYESDDGLRTTGPPSKLQRTSRLGYKKQG